MAFNASHEHLFSTSLPDLSLHDFSSLHETAYRPAAADSAISIPAEAYSLSHKDHNPPEHGPTDRDVEDPKGKPGTGPPISLPHEILFVALICLAMFTAQVGLGQVLNIIYIIGSDFHTTSLGTLSWFPAGYSLTCGTFVLVSGRLGDLFGYKRMLVIGYVWFAVWTLIAGLSVYSNDGGVLFIFARTLAGIGPAITMPNGLAIFGVLYPEGGMRKAMVFALFGACAPSGSIVGSAFAGIFAELAWWPWTFWSFAVVLAGIAAASVVVVPPMPRLAVALRGWVDFVERVDAVGAVLGVASLVLVNFAWNQAGVVGWEKAYVYVCLILGLLVFFPAFIFVEMRISKHPLIPFHALSGQVAVVLTCVACGWASMGIWLFYLVQFYLVLRGAPPLLVSAWFSPIAASGLLASVTTGYLLGKLPATWIMVLSMTFFTVGSVLVATAPVHQSYWAQTFVCSLVIPWGMDMSFPAGTIIMSNSVPAEHQGVAASLMMTIVNYSISLGLGFASTVDIHVNNGGKTSQDVLRGFRGAWYMGIGMAGLGLVISLFFAARDLFRGKMAAKSGFQAVNARDRR